MGTRSPSISSNKQRDQCEETSSPRNLEVRGTVHRTIGIDTTRITPTNFDSVTCYLPKLRGIKRSDVFHPMRLENCYKPLIDELMLTLNQNSFVQPFDWISWQKRGASYCRNRNKIANTTLATCVKLFTLHVRKDRYCTNHFGCMVEEGHIQAILTRLTQLRRQCGLLGSFW